MKKLIAMLVIASAPAAAWAEAVAIKGVRLWPAPDNTRIVFDVSAPVDYKLERLANPDRLVLDFSNATLEKGPEQPVATDVLMKAVRSARRLNSISVKFDHRPGATLIVRIRTDCVSFRQRDAPNFM